MEDLTGRFPAALVPSSMNPGNTTADAPNLAMTAPGSPSVNPAPENADRLPLPVGSAKPRSTIVAGHDSGGSGSPWTGFSDSGR